MTFSREEGKSRGTPKGFNPNTEIYKTRMGNPEGVEVYVRTEGKQGKIHAVCSFFATDDGPSIKEKTTSSLVALSQTR